jgi:RNA-directed DNA polymerase
MPTGFESVISSWLSDDMVSVSEFYKDEYNVFQVGVIFTLILNFTLDGLEASAFKNVKKSMAALKLGKKTVLDLSFTLVRYADGFVIITNHPRNLSLIKMNVKTFLATRGLQIDEGKSHDILFCHKSQEKENTPPKFDFLGFTFMYQYNIRLSRIVSKRDMTNSAKVIISPRRKNVLAFKRKIKKLIGKNTNLTAIQLLQKLNPVIQGWATYFSISICAKILNEIDNYIYKRLWRWCSRKHSRIGKFFLADKYFKMSASDGIISPVRKKWHFYG